MTRTENRQITNEVLQIVSNGRDDQMIILIPYQRPPNGDQRLDNTPGRLR